MYHKDVSISRIANQPYITGEASANTFYEVEPQLVRQYLPKIKLIVLLRNPMDRAFSHYRMYQRFQEEGRTLSFKVRDFETEVKEEIALIQSFEQHGFTTGMQVDTSTFIIMRHMGLHSLLTRQLLENYGQEGEVLPEYLPWGLNNGEL